jgi:phospholipid/cholesterol/gamma-HCH transport system substrate-binding protein
MQSRFLEILVGFFVCLGVAAVFILTLRVASLNDVGSGGQGSYHVSAKFDNIGKLSVGNAVKIAGVTVGRVSNIQVDQSDFQAVVTLEISKVYNQIPGDVGASVLTAGLLGEQYIGLEGGGALDPIKEGGKIKLTQSALVIEKLIGQFLNSMGKSEAPAEAPAAE